MHGGKRTLVDYQREMNPTVEEKMNHEREKASSTCDTRKNVGL